jgi:hypothetical protein
MSLYSVVSHDHERLTELAQASRELREGGDSRAAVDCLVTAVAAHVTATRKHLCELTGEARPVHVDGLRALETAAQHLLRHSLGDMTVIGSRAALVDWVCDEIERHIALEHAILAPLVNRSDERADAFLVALQASPSRPHPWLWRAGGLRRLIEPLMVRLDAARDVMDSRVPLKAPAAVLP